MVRHGALTCVVAGFVLAGTPALAQKTGQDGTVIDENTELPRAAAGHRRAG